MDNQHQQKIQIKATDEALKGLYANMAQVAHNPEEFVIDFMNVFPPAGSLLARVVLSPGHMKRLAQAMAENIKKYEEQFGEIKSVGQPDHKIGFRTE